MKPTPDIKIGYMVPSRTHRQRGYCIERADVPGEGEYRVSIVQGQRGTRYFLEEADCLGFLGRRFIWVKAVSGECYETHVGDNHRDWACTCTAGRVHHHLCKHAETLWDAILKGHLPKSKPL